MNKVVIGAIAVVALAAAAYSGAGFLARGTEGATPGTAAPAPASASTPAPASAAGQPGDPSQPDRTAEVKGTVVSVKGTTVVIDRLQVDPSEELTDEQKAAKRAERQAMSMEDRQAAKAAEQAGTSTERVSVEVPVGVPMSRMVPGEDEPTAKPATLADLKAGVTVSIWTDGKTDGGVAEYVKVQAGS